MRPDAGTDRKDAKKEWDEAEAAGLLSSPVREEYFELLSKGRSMQNSETMFHIVEIEGCQSFADVERRKFKWSLTGGHSRDLFVPYRVVVHLDSMVHSLDIDPQRCKIGIMCQFRHEGARIWKLR
jgi:hypothetical protein